MRALYLSTRLAGTDGVSLETRKMAQVLERFGFETAYCAGELDETGPLHHLIPEMHFKDPVAEGLGREAFREGEQDEALEGRILERAGFLKEEIAGVLEVVKPDLLVLQNVWAIPMQLPLAKALADLVVATDLPCLSHEHDYAWERERFSQCRVRRYLMHYFPFDAPTARHLCINSPAQEELYGRRGIQATLLPNVFDFDTPAPGIDDFNRNFRKAIGLTAEQRLFLQPTRVVPRKGIELAIDLLARLEDPRNVLVITHQAGDEGLDYLRSLERQARAQGVDFRYVADRVDEARGERGGRKVYSLWDSYSHADFVTYPSLYEGFGNALLETIYFRKPALVNRYSVYAADIAPKGFRFIEIDGSITPDAVRAVQEVLEHPEKGLEMAEHNYRLAQEHYGYTPFRRTLAGELQLLGFSLAEAQA